MLPMPPPPGGMPPPAFFFGSSATMASVVISSAASSFRFVTPQGESIAQPKSLPTSVRILLWQGVQECQSVDYNRANPVTAVELLSGLVLPPDMETEWLLSFGEETAIS
jgi:hypothetical protein